MAVPVNGDFEGGFAIEPDGVAANVTRAVATGVAGLSIEDSTGDSASPLFEFALSVERIKAARRAIDASGTGVILTGRSEGFIVGRPDLSETIRRLTAYARAGADCLYAPGIAKDEEIAAVVQAVAPKPVNVLVGGDFAPSSDWRKWVFAASVLAARWRAHLGGFLNAAKEIAEHGTFAALGRGTPGRELNNAFARDPSALGLRTMTMTRTLMSFAVATVLLTVGLARALWDASAPDAAGNAH